MPLSLMSQRGHVWFAVLLPLSVMCRRNLHFTGSKLCVLQVLQQLPEGLAIAVLAASPADLDHHLSILPASLHPLAIEAAFPSIRQRHCLTLNFYSLRKPATANVVLHAATAGTTARSVLQELDLKYIPVTCNDCLPQLIAVACSSASDVQLHFDYRFQDIPTSPPFEQVGKALSLNSVLTSLQLTFEGDPSHVFNLDCLFESLSGLQSLKLSSECRDTKETSCRSVPVPCPA
jgi:hypothetical protein